MGEIAHGWCQADGKECLIVIILAQHAGCLSKILLDAAAVLAASGEILQDDILEVAI